MGESLAGAWVSQYGTVDDDAFVTWCNALKGFAPSQIEAGFHRYLKSNDPFLDLVKFTGYCQDLANKPPSQNAQAYLPYREDSSDEAVQRFDRLTGNQGVPFLEDKRADDESQIWKQKLANAKGDARLVGKVYLEMMHAAIEKGECKTRQGLEKHLRILGKHHLMPSKSVFP